MLSHAIFSISSLDLSFCAMSCSWDTFLTSSTVVQKTTGDIYIVWILCRDKLRLCTSINSRM